MYEFTHLKERISAVSAWLHKELANIQTGRATPSFLDGIMIESYGTKIPITQTASITAEDAKTLRVAPYDSSQIKAIESAINAANLGVSVAVDDKGVRVIFPALTTETREKYVKLAKNKLEDARVSLRRERDHTNSDIEAKAKGGDLSEDQKKNAKEEVEKLVKKGNESFADITSKKEGEILG